MKLKKHIKKGTALACIVTMVCSPIIASADIAATHIYHNHMPNFWPYYNLSNYDKTPVGGDIRYMYDGQVVDLKNAPPQDYNYYLENGLPMPHDDLNSYYSHHAKTGAYHSWPMDTAKNNNSAHPQSQSHVTMSASVVNNVDSLNNLCNVSGYCNPNWGDYWRDTQQGVKTQNGADALDLIHFTGHHSMGPLVGNDYFLKELIFHNVTLAQPYFLGNGYKSSKGFFPTELGFSERMIPVLEKMGIEWSVMGNLHFSRTLRDYPYLNDPGKDTMVSPPNRADMQNESNVGDWLSQQMFNEQQVTHNKFPFASFPHYVQYVNPETGIASKIAGIPVEQAASWEESYQGSVTASAIKPYEDDANSLNRRQYFVIAHDGDNSSGRAGDGGTWNNSGYVTYSDSGVSGVGVDEYLASNPIPQDDIVHVQDGSWIDTRDSSADPTWYHWRLPMGIWSGQFSDFNTAMGMDLSPLKNYQGIEQGTTVSFEYGYHYLERNFALQQAAENYAKTAEQIWLDAHPNHWSPTSSLDNEVTYAGNQLNPWMMSYPVKGDASQDYAGGANPAELAWYFLLPALDSGFGYYDENIDDGVKPTLSFNQSLYFSEPYVNANLSDDRTGPSLWWPQRYPYNPGSANVSKAQGWTLQYYSTDFAIYTYAYDVSNISDIKVKVRAHKNQWADAQDNTFKVYDPAAAKASGAANIDPSRVGDWITYSMNERDLQKDINGVPWQTANQHVMDQVPAQKIGNLYYSYIGDYKNQLLDYYIEATDAKGNVTKSQIQQVYVGTGQFKQSGEQIIEDSHGDIDGVYPFITSGDQPNGAPVININASATQVVLGMAVTLDASNSRDDGAIVTWSWSNGSSEQIITLQNNELGSFEYTLTLTDDEGLISSKSVTIEVLNELPKSSTYATMNFRGTSNGWLAGAMELVDDYTWKISKQVFTGSNNDRYKFDVAGDWQTNFGNHTANGICEQGGDDIMLSVAGTYDVYFNDKTLACWSKLVTTGNTSPKAMLSATALEINLGDSVTLDASASHDAESSLSYAWSVDSSTLSSLTLTPLAVGITTVTLTVSDAQGATDTASISVNIIDPNHFTSTFATMNFRGTANNWAATPMSLVANNVWAVYVTFGSGSDERFKFDEKGDWSNNFGNNGTDIAISQGAGDYHITFNDNTQTYTVVKQGSNTGYTSTYPTMHFRGTANNWDATAMTLEADHVWGINVTFSAASDARFKFDAKGDWSNNFGDNDNDIYIMQGMGDYHLTFNDRNQQYTVTKIKR